jgi:hypothetical protein
VACGRLGSWFWLGGMPHFSSLAPWMHCSWCSAGLDRDSLGINVFCLEKKLDQIRNFQPKVC